MSETMKLKTKEMQCECNIRIPEECMNRENKQ